MLLRWPYLRQIVTSIRRLLWNEITETNTDHCEGLSLMCLVSLRRTRHSIYLKEMRRAIRGAEAVTSLSQIFLIWSYLHRLTWPITWWREGMHPLYQRLMEMLAPAFSPNLELQVSRLTNYQGRTSAEYLWQSERRTCSARWQTKTHSTWHLISQTHTRAISVRTIRPICSKPV